MTPIRSPLTVLLAVDGSSYSDAEAKLVAGITWPAGTSVRVLAIVPERLPLLGLSPETQRVVDEMLTGARQQDWATAETLAVRVADQLHAHDLITEAQVRERRPAEGILEQAVALSADLIVVGARGRTRAGPFRMGDVAQKVVKYASYSVLVVR